MARARSRIKTELPPDLLAELNTQIVDGRKTIDQLRAWLAEKGVEIPRTNLGRHVQEVEQMASTLRETREIVKVVSERIGPDEDAGAMTDQLVEMLHAVVYRGFTGLLADPEKSLAPEDLHFMARTLKDAAAAKKANVDRLINAAKLAAAKEAAAAATRDAATKAKEAIQSRGMSADVAEAIEKAVLGLA